MGFVFAILDVADLVEDGGRPDLQAELVTLRVRDVHASGLVVLPVADASDDGAGRLHILLALLLSLDHLS